MGFTTTFAGQPTAGAQPAPAEVQDQGEKRPGKDTCRRRTDREGCVAVYVRPNVELFSVGGGPHGTTVMFGGNLGFGYNRFGATPFYYGGRWSGSPMERLWGGELNYNIFQSFSPTHLGGINIYGVGYTEDPTYPRNEGLVGAYSMLQLGLPVGQLETKGERDLALGFSARGFFTQFMGLGLAGKVLGTPLADDPSVNFLLAMEFSALSFGWSKSN